MITITQQDLSLAFNANHEGYLRKIHLYLNKNYHAMLFQEKSSFALNDEEWRQFKYIEKVWMSHEVKKCFSRYDCYQAIQSDTDVKLALIRHPVYHHKLFDYLQHDAPLSVLKEFILNDSILNLEFFDYLALSIVGASEEAKSEIINNLWDEAGRGNIGKCHTRLFRNLMDGLQLSYKREMIIENMSWEGLAGINLFSYLSQSAQHKMKYYGLLAATEMLDPPHYHELLKGMTRLLKPDVDCTYYVEHESIDIEHAHGWLNKVILPELHDRPTNVSEFWIGFYLRLDSAQQYFDTLLNIFSAKQAA